MLFPVMVCCLFAFFAESLLKSGIPDDLLSYSVAGELPSVLVCPLSALLVVGFGSEIFLYIGKAVRARPRS